MILEKRRMTIDEVANLFEISHGSAYDTGLAFVKSMQDGFLNNSPKSTGTIV